MDECGWKSPVCGHLLWPPQGAPTFCVHCPPTGTNTGTVTLSGEAGLGAPSLPSPTSQPRPSSSRRSAGPREANLL